MRTLTLIIIILYSSTLFALLPKESLLLLQKSSSKELFIVNLKSALALMKEKIKSEQADLTRSSYVHTESSLLDLAELIERKTDCAQLAHTLQFRVNPKMDAPTTELSEEWNEIVQLIPIFCNLPSKSSEKRIN